MTTLPSRQQGAGLLFFVVMMTVIALSFVLGYSGVMARQQATSSERAHREYVAQSLLKIEQAWRLNAYAYDSPASQSSLTVDSVLSNAGVLPRFGMEAVLSGPLVDPATNLTYKVLAIYLPRILDGEAAIDFTGFKASGVLPPCSGATCPDRILESFSSLDLERELNVETNARLNRIALKAQAYFKARMLQTPERDVSINYFRKPSIDCVVSAIDLDCLDAYTPLSEMTDGSTLTASRTANNLALGSGELLTAWGQPIEASTLLDSSTSSPPYTMVFRAKTPTGAYLKVIAVQQL